MDGLQQSAAPARGGAGLLGDTPESAFFHCINRHGFAFRHGLAEHPLFSLDGLLALARSRSDDIHHAYWSNGAVALPDPWEKGWNAQPSLTGTIAGIEGNDSLVMLKHLEQDAAVAGLIGELFARILELCGVWLRGEAVLARATVILASPGRVTPYHIDADCNFLLQLSGRRRFSVLDPGNRQLLRDEEMENFFAGDFNGAQFKPECHRQARHYALGPGDGVHIPCTAPHWCTNGAAVSIALSLAYDLRSEYRKARIHQFNRRLRRWGLNPIPPQQCAWRDGFKLGVKNAWDAARAMLGHRGDASITWGWRPPLQRPLPAPQRARSAAAVYMRKLAAVAHLRPRAGLRALH